MSALRTTNPLLTERAFEPLSPYGNLDRADAARRSEMTLQGTVNASFILLGICTGVAIMCWSLFQKHPQYMMLGTLGGSLLTLVLCLIMAFKQSLAPYFALPVAIGQGALAGGASVMWSAYAGKSTGVAGALGTGLVIQALLLTVGIAGGLLLAYKTRVIKVTENFKLAVFAATMGLLFVSLGTLVLGLFGIKVPYIWDNGIIGIGFAGFIVVLAAMNLVLDFDFIEQGSQNRLPKHMEWYAAIGLLVTLVWLYISILRLLAKLSRRE